MESNSKLHPQNLQNPHDFEWPYHEDFFPFDKALELPPLDIDGFLDFNNSLSLPFHWDNILELETEIFSPDKRIITPPPPLYDETVRMIKLEEDDERSSRKELQEVTRMINERGFSSWKLEEEEDDDDDEKMRLRLSLLRNGRRKSSVLGLEEIQKHFDIPISEAAKKMNVGLTVLKKRCRELNIMRWPHRKLKSLKSLIQNVKELGLTNELKGLEEHKRLVEELPDMDLTHRTKRLRQACFKANYKKRRSNISALH